MRGRVASHCPSEGPPLSGKSPCPLNLVLEPLCRIRQDRGARERREDFTIGYSPDLLDCMPEALLADAER
jgi:hypothetical protein